MDTIKTYLDQIEQASGKNKLICALEVYKMNKGSIINYNKRLREDAINDPYNDEILNDMLQEINDLKYIDAVIEVVSSIIENTMTKSAICKALGDIIDGFIKSRGVLSRYRNHDETFAYREFVLYNTIMDVVREYQYPDIMIKENENK